MDYATHDNRQFFERKDPKQRKNIKSAEEIRERAIKKHGAKANDYQYLDLEGRVAVGTELFDVLEKHEQYAEEIVKKFNLYKETFSLYE